MAANAEDLKRAEEKRRAEAQRSPYKETPGRQAKTAKLIDETHNAAPHRATLLPVVYQFVSEHLQGNYSEALYGAPGRVRPRSLRVI